VLAERKRKCAKKAAERDKYTVTQLARLREQGNLAGFEIFEEDTEWFMRSRAGSLSRLGFESEEIERALPGLIERYCANGKAYVASNADRIHEVAFNSDPETRPADWYKRQSQKQTHVRTGLSFTPLPQILSKREQREEVMREAIAQFPATVATYESNSRFEEALAAIGFTFDPQKGHRHREWASSALKATGYKWDMARQVWHRARRKP
jgi:hypothetical protein